jgi:hypothetical protein
MDTPSSGSWTVSSAVLAMSRRIQAYGTASFHVSKAPTIPRDMSTRQVSQTACAPGHRGPRHQGRQDESAIGGRSDRCTSYPSSRLTGSIQIRVVISYSPSSLSVCHGAASQGDIQPAFSVSTFKVASWGPFALRGAPTPRSEAISQNALG